MFLLLTTSQIISSLNLIRARRTMTELKATGLVDMINSNAPGEDKIVVRKQFSWFLTEEFNNLRSLKEKHLPRYDTSQSHFANLIYDHVINRKLASYRHNSFNETSYLRRVENSFNAFNPP